jgi:undecaprenyl-diphosphatase
MFESILLGILQGLTEFLPVSSSGHLVLAQSLLPGFDGPAVAFDVLLHVGTLAAVLIYFRRDLIRIVKDLFHPREGGLHLPLLLVVGTVPAALTGVFLADAIKPLFAAPRSASIGLLITSFLLFAAWKVGTVGNRSLNSLTFQAALIIGVLQAVAIVPGISRSGATIAAGVFLGLSGRDAARFSFLLSIPAIAGALLLESGALREMDAVAAYTAGALAAALTGWASVAYLMRLLGKGRLLPFAVYCLVLGVLSFVFLV